MRGVSEDELINIADQLCVNERLIIYDRIMPKCRELQEPWMTLDEFLRSGFIGDCWICEYDKTVYTAGYSEDGYFYISKTSSSRIDMHFITNVMHIHKP